MPAKKLLLLLVFCVYAANALAQATPDTALKQPISDSTVANRNEVRSPSNSADTGVHKPQPWQPNPKKAGLFSAILPGTGQIYNKQYWKLPLVYGGAGAVVYFIQFNTDKYQTYRKAYVASLEGKTHEFTGIYDQGALKQLQDGYKRYLDMTYLFSAVGYALQVIDAIVFAHLQNFDVSRDLSVRFQPVAMPNGGAGFGLVMNIK